MRTNSQPSPPRSARSSPRCRLPVPPRLDSRAPTTRRRPTCTSRRPACPRRPRPTSTSRRRACTTTPATHSAKANVYVPPAALSTNPKPISRHVTATSAPASGFDWGSAGIGAAVVVGALLIGLGGAAEARLLLGARSSRLRPASRGGAIPARRRAPGSPDASPAALELAVALGVALAGAVNTASPSGTATTPSTSSGHRSPHTAWWCRACDASRR